MDCNLATKHWDMRFNLGVLGIICVNAYLVFQQVVYVDNKKTSCLKFFGKLADVLIDNQEGIRMTRARTAKQGAWVVADAAVTSTPTVRRTLQLKHSKGKHYAHGRCHIKGCTKHTYVCSACTHATKAAQKQFWFCNSTTVDGSNCFAKHIAWHREQENRGGGN